MTDKGGMGRKGGKGWMGRKGRKGGKGGMGKPLSLVAGLVLLYGASGSSWTFTQQPRAEMQRVPQFDNDRATSWKSIIPPHTESTFHRHDRYRSVIAIVGGDLKTVAPGGKTTVTHYESGKSYWFAPMAAGETHKDVNDTDKTIELVVVELK
jgi:hypothetical protein